MTWNGEDGEVREHPTKQIEPGRTPAYDELVGFQTNEVNVRMEIRFVEPEGVVCESPRTGRDHPPDDVIGDLPSVFTTSSQEIVIEYRVPDGFVLSSPMAVRNAALMGYGCALVANFIVTDDIAAGRLVQLLPEYESMEQPICAIFPHRTYIPAKVRIFVDYLIEHFGRGN